MAKIIHFENCVRKCVSVELNVALCLRVFYDTISKINPNRMWEILNLTIRINSDILPLIAMVSGHFKKIINDLSRYPYGCRKKTHHHFF